MGLFLDVDCATNGPDYGPNPIFNQSVQKHYGVIDVAS